MSFKTYKVHRFENGVQSWFRLNSEAVFVGFPGGTTLESTISVCWNGTGPPKRRLFTDAHNMLIISLLTP
jgi:hypothetical protein